MLINLVRNNLTDFIDLLSLLSDVEFTEKHTELSQATIGEHTRHSIELFQCLINQYEIDVVNYDKRERNEYIQNSCKKAINAIQKLLENVNKPNKSLTLQQGIQQPTLSIETNYFRELLYNWEHTIHHQALIKVAMLKLKHIEIPENFGVAKSTLEYRLQCAP